MDRADVGAIAAGEEAEGEAVRSGMPTQEQQAELAELFRRLIDGEIDAFGEPVPRAA